MRSAANYAVRPHHERVKSVSLGCPLLSTEIGFAESQPTIYAVCDSRLSAECLCKTDHSVCFLMFEEPSNISHDLQHHLRDQGDQSDPSREIVKRTSETCSGVLGRTLYLYVSIQVHDILSCDNEACSALVQHRFTDVMSLRHHTLLARRSVRFRPGLSSFCSRKWYVSEACLAVLARNAHRME